MSDVQVEKVDPHVEKMSKELLRSLITEFKNSRWIPSHVGNVAEVRTAPTKERLYVIKYLDGYVYMLGREAPEYWADMSETSLLGKEIKFKVMTTETPVIYVSARMCTDLYRLACLNHNTMSGTIVSSYYDKDDPDKSYFRVMAYGDILTMPAREVTIYTVYEYLPYYVNQKIHFKVKDVTKDGEVIVSKAMVEAEQRDAVIDRIKKMPEGFVAPIMKVTDAAAYLQYDDVIMIMRNRDFSTDYTPINMVKHRGDTIRVKLHEISPSKRILVEPVEKYTSPTKVTLDKFKAGMVVKGEVVGVNSWGLFVRVAPGIDIVCGTPATFAPERGDIVEARILFVHPQQADARHKGKMKGVVMAIVQKQGIPVGKQKAASAVRNGKEDKKNA